MREGLTIRLIYEGRVLGHVVYEMGSGATLTSGVPSKEDYKKVKDKSVREFLQDIFKGVVKAEPSSRDPNPGKWIKDVCSFC